MNAGRKSAFFIAIVVDARASTIVVASAASFNVLTEHDTSLLGPPGSTVHRLLFKIPLKTAKGPLDFDKNWTF